MYANIRRSKKKKKLIYTILIFISISNRDVNNPLPIGSGICKTKAEIIFLASKIMFKIRNDEKKKLYAYQLD